MFAHQMMKMRKAAYQFGQKFFLSSLELKSIACDEIAAP